MIFEGPKSTRDSLLRTTSWVAHDTAIAFLNAYDRGRLSERFSNLRLIGGLAVYFLYVLPAATYRRRKSERRNGS